MLVLLSPAKNLNFDPAKEGLTTTQPDFLADTRKLVKAARELSASELQGLMHINEKLAELNVQRFKNFKLQNTDNATTKAAALAFNGEVYNGLKAQTLSEDDLLWAQDHLRILSGLYGALRPLDEIQPYRLEMGSKLRTQAGPNLYSFWGDKITRKLKKALKESGSNVIVNLASNEYFGAVQEKDLGARVITAQFKEVRQGVAKSLMVYMKKARGMMARYIIENRITDPEQLTGFAEDGYRLNTMLTKGDTLVFTRESERKAA